MNCLVLPTMGMNYPTVNLFIWIKTISFYLWRISNINIICYRLFAEASAGSYPHAAPQYHDRPKAKRGIAVLNVDEFLYPRQQTRGSEFVSCSNIWNLFEVLKSCWK